MTRRWMIVFAGLVMAFALGCHKHVDGPSDCAGAEKEHCAECQKTSPCDEPEPCDDPSPCEESGPCAGKAELPEAGEERATALIERMVAKVGTMDRLKRLRDVEYTYTYGDPASGAVDVSTERYVFEGEKSWARYETHAKSVFPDRDGVVVQGYDGESTWVTLDGEELTDEQAVRMADFLRKTNFYWLTMMQKLLDPGLVYSHEGTRAVDGLDYEIVKVGFGDGVGDFQDTYVLYVNPVTGLVDRFLFTVMDFGVETPHLMVVEYAEVARGVKLPVYRRYAPADWDGNVLEPSWTHEIVEDVSFGNGFADALFERPTS